MQSKKRQVFLGVEPAYHSYENSKFVVIPCPYEATTTYGKGTRNGPKAILSASQQVECFDEELGFEPYLKSWIYTFKPVTFNHLPKVVEKVVRDKKFR